MKHCIAILLIAFVAACANAPSTSPSAANTKLEFVDVESFDRTLNASLSSKLPSVDVVMVNSTTATAIPPRLQDWLHAVEVGGGSVKVSPPPSTVTAKNPMLLLSLISGIWNATKALKSLKTFELHKPAQQYDADILLKISDNGERLIDKIIFTARKPAS